MPLPPAPPVPVPRILTRVRPAADPACAGCAQLGLFRALRRAGLGVQGGPGCDPDAPRVFVPVPGRGGGFVPRAPGARPGAGAAPRVASERGRRVLVALSACTRGAPASAPLVV